MNNLAKLGLGTVQWGLAYGIANQNGMTTPDTVATILSRAQSLGIKVLDTASLYGDAETVLGANALEAFNVVTKTPRFATPVISDEQTHSLVETFHLSLEKLSTTRVYGLLIHHAQDLLVPGGDKLVTAVRALQENNAVQKVGVSVYDSEQLDALLNVFTPDIIQLPVSVLDQRLLLNGQLERLKQKGIEIHARSVFLQGLLLMPLERVPAYFDPIRPLLGHWHAAAERQGMSPTQAALSFVKGIPYVDTVLVGVDNLDQFEACVKDFSKEVQFDASNLACNDPQFVNPALWKVS